MKVNATLPIHLKGERLDKSLATVFPDYSRTKLQKWLNDGYININGDKLSQNYQVVGGERINIDIPQPQTNDWVAEDIPLEIKFEDEAVLVVGKPAGLVVHPGAGNPDGTLMNALLWHNPCLEHLPRAGIVHRLDKNTSGLLVVAKTESVRLNLIKQFKARRVGRQYVGIVQARLISGGTIDAPISRNSRDRKKMTVGVGRPAVSHYRIISRYRAHTLVRINLETGRTHQIRVHFRHAGFPLVGDPDYGLRPRVPAGSIEELRSALTGLKRQALHAEELRIDHPLTGERCSWHWGVPQDLRKLIVALKRDSEIYEN